MKDDRVYLKHILDAVGAIEDYTKGGQDAFAATRMIQDAVIRNLEVIGEAVKNLSPTLRGNHPEIPWQRIAGLRDILIHQYFGVDLGGVWGVVANRLPELKRHIEQLLNASA